MDEPDWFNSVLARCMGTIQYLAHLSLDCEKKFIHNGLSVVM
jgi:hypothetical protein